MGCGRGRVTVTSPAPVGGNPGHYTCNLYVGSNIEPPKTIDDIAIGDQLSDANNKCYEILNAGTKSGAYRNGLTVRDVDGTSAGLVGGAGPIWTPTPNFKLSQVSSNWATFGVCQVYNQRDNLLIDVVQSGALVYTIYFSPIDNILIVPAAYNFGAQADPPFVSGVLTVNYGGVPNATTLIPGLCSLFDVSGTIETPENYFKYVELNGSNPTVWVDKTDLGKFQIRGDLVNQRRYAFSFALVPTWGS